MTKLDLKKHMTAVLMPVAPEDWLIDRCCDVAVMYANSLNLKTTNMEKQLSKESHSDQVIDLMNKNAYEDIERLANLEFQDVADEGLFPNHSDKDIWINGFVSAYVYFKNQNDTKTEWENNVANQLYSASNLVLSFAHYISNVVRKSGMTENDLHHIFPMVFHILKTDSDLDKQNQP